MDADKKFREILSGLFMRNEEEMIPATQGLLDAFCDLSRVKGLTSEVIDQLVSFYAVTNGVPCLDGFDFHRCDDIILFEWWDQQELWLGQRDMDTLRWTNLGFCLGDASNVSYGQDYQFPTLLQLIEKGLKDWQLQ